MKLGVAQMAVTDDVEQNLKAAADAVKRLAAQGAQIVALPEMFCCPYENKSFVAAAECAGGRIYSASAECAAKNSVFLVAGSMPERDGERLYNTAFVFSPSGAQLARHRKVHLFDINIRGGQRFLESETFSPGDAATVFQTPFGTFGVCICFDIRFPELSRRLALCGAEAILVPAAFNRTTGPMHWELTFRARAVDNQVFCVGIAPAQDVRAPYVSYGHSIVASPWGKVLVELDEQEESFVAELDLDEVRRVREELPLLSARREDVYG